jgi:asparagine synthase (glutamine-hydrolysing)
VKPVERLGTMSVQFGRCNLDGEPVDPRNIDQVRTVLAPYGPDGEGYICRDNFGILYRAFQTTKESRNEVQPHLSKSGAIITWDGRLDNREELIGQLGRELSSNSTDLTIVSAAQDRWGTDCFARLIGDWALSIWDQKDQSLVLAKDFVGTRHLYYSVENDRVTWCTVLDPLVLFAGRSFILEEEYIAGWLSFFPAPHLTPYVGIHSVPPSCFVRLAKGTHQLNRYWDFNPAKKIRYRTDAEYEEHFRDVFAESIRRRLRSGTPVLAELSGGMDSSSIVCMADEIICHGGAETPKLNTLSYYDDSEPNWNERPYYSRVEEKRGRTGCHIDVGSQGSLRFKFDNDDFAIAPGSRKRASEARGRFADCMISQGCRVLLSGIGGDEVTGGVPTPIPELANLLATGRIWTLMLRLKIWALNRRKPWFHLLQEVLRGFLPTTLFGTSSQLRSAPWLQPGFVRKYQPALTAYSRTWTLRGGLPSFQENLGTLDVLRRELSCDAFSYEPLYERRLPYLDRDLLEILFAMPREQLVRPGQRRSLLRRALAGIVPQEILNRPRKAYVARSSVAAILAEWPALVDMSHHMISSALGIVDSTRFAGALQEARQGHIVPTVFLARTVMVEVWLRTTIERQILSDDVHAAFDYRQSQTAKAISLS